ncbi:putative transglutaminase-like cysteine proteinase [Bradyrhizobium sp. CIR48]|uniref:transglutaminase-like cysteine peptidase n=1 Tax=Bradyrhizobium sp. Rc3b TaxID=1855322 RepID=UPI0008DFB7D8|nr:transglutaminase-like cysteine peptidase [Bradyrhizobium sp. CIR48]MBB4425796.1 putative transglutaminase-like cysteine proteinase [Bradyrhizobium sp. CIR48]SFN72102.1 Predicted transglutaminase-like cysteine proteinase [Bradyrhizobium sp. Rc3b]
MIQRTSGPVIAGAIALVIGGVQWARAALLVMPKPPRADLAHIELGRPALPPLTYTVFCLRYEAECRPRRFFRGGPIRLTKERWAELDAVNRAVNRAIVPQPNELGLAHEEWLINPARGDCNDYAVSKRHELLQRGWPARVLLLSEVVRGSGDHHLVLVVRARTGDLVLDNLTPEIKPWSRAQYGWIRMQTPRDNRMWATTGRSGA